MKRFSKIISVVLSLSLILGVLAVIPVTASAQSALPTKAPGNADYADDITGFGASMYGTSAADINALMPWNNITKGFTTSGNISTNGATLATVPALSDSETAVLETSISATTFERADIIFRARYNTDYYALYVWPTAVALYKYTYTPGGNSDYHVATPVVPYSYSANDRIVIESGDNKVSVWINGTQYFSDVAIETTGYAPAFGFNTYSATDFAMSNTSLYLTRLDPVLNQTAPQKTVDNTDYADSITGFGASMYGTSAADMNALMPWNSITKGFTTSGNISTNGATLATVPALSDSETTVLETSISATDFARADIIFRARYNTDYYALYVWPTAVALYKYTYTPGGNSDYHVATSVVPYSYSANDRIVIKSGDNKVSVWINGTQYFRDVAIETTGYVPAFGFNTYSATDFAMSNTSLYLTRLDPVLNQTAPQKTAGNADYAEYITGFGASMHGTSAADMNALMPWNSTTKGFTTSGAINTNGATLAYHPALDASETAVLETSISATDFARVDVVFRTHFITDYYALYVWPTAVALYKYTYTGGNNDDHHIATSVVPYSYSANDRIVIKSGDNKVSVWINGTQYFRDVAIETDIYTPSFGVNTYSATDLAMSNTSLYLTRSDPALNQSAPTAIEGNINYAEDITGFSKAAWSDENVASTMPDNYVTLGDKYFSQHNHFAYGGYLAQGYAADGTSPCLLETDVYTSNASGRVDVIFRAVTLADYYALYIYGSEVRLYRWTPGAETEVALSYIPFTRSVSGTNHVTVLSTQSAVSVWIDGTQYFRDVAISATGYAAVIGMNTNGMTDGTDTVSFSNLGLYLNVPDYDLTYAPTSDVYMLKNGVYYGIAPGTTVSTFRSNVVTSSNVYTYQIVNNSAVVTSGNMSTGMQVQVLVNSEPIAGVYEVAVRGDLDGDGQMLASDLTCLVNHLIGSEELTGAKLFAADPYDSESLPDITTLVWMKKALAGSTSVADPQHVSTYSENSFKIGAYVDGYHLDNATNVFTALKNANVNLVVPTNWPAAKTANEYAQVLDTAESVGIDYLVDVGTASGQNALSLRSSGVSSLTATYKNREHAYGYHLTDEPSVSQFSSMNLVNDLIRKYDPSAAVFSCLLPSYGRYKWSGSTTSFTTYINKYFSIAKPQILGNDYYIYTESSTPNLNVYDIWRDMGYLRKSSIENNTPYWHVFQGITDYDYATTTGMTLAKYSVQMKSALAYGCKAAIYFTGVETFCDSNGNISDQYSDLAGLNTQVQRIGNLIYNATSTEIYHPRIDSSYTSSYYLSDVSESALISSFSTSGNRNKNIICSVLEDSSNYYVLFVNKSVDSSASYDVSLKNARSAAEFNVADNVIGAASSTSTLSGTVGAGDIRVYVLAK